MILYTISFMATFMPQNNNFMSQLVDTKQDFKNDLAFAKNLEI